ncbi:MAG: hypothetical protein ACK5OX_05050 [Desertimonas sp.]
MVDPAKLASSRRGYVIAAAGCGKTELIANAVAGQAEGRALVLTHTHAGVGALRSRLRSKGVAARRVSVETLTGFALRFASAYPRTSGWEGTAPTGAQWSEVQDGARRVFDTNAGKSVLKASFSGIYVDEYQDCTEDQHSLVNSLAEVLPTRLLGDPLQGTFGFAGKLVDWDLVQSTYDDLGELTTPHRWQPTNPALGDWLIDARARLLAGEQPDWSNPAITVGTCRDADQILACGRFRTVPSVVAIRKWARDEQAVASRLGGAFTSMETIDSKDLFATARRFDAATGTSLAIATIDLAELCMTNTGGHLKAARRSLTSDRVPTPRQGAANAVAVEALGAVAANGHSAVPNALDAIMSLPNVRVYRHELLDESLRALRSRRDGSERTLEQIAWNLRDDARRRGRAVPTRVVSRTLLVKGLEFDHALVLNANELSAEELYVAITRPRVSLTVLR